MTVREIKWNTWQECFDFFVPITDDEDKEFKRQAFRSHLEVLIAVTLAAYGERVREMAASSAEDDDEAHRSICIAERIRQMPLPDVGDALAEHDAQLLSDRDFRWLKALCFDGDCSVFTVEGNIEDAALHVRAKLLAPFVALVEKWPHDDCSECRHDECRIGLFDADKHCLRCRRCAVTYAAADPQAAIRAHDAQIEERGALRNHGEWVKLLLGRDGLPLPTTPEGIVKEHDAQVEARAIEWAVEWTLKQTTTRENWPQSWDAGFPSYKASALLSRPAALEAAAGKEGK